MSRWADRIQHIATFASWKAQRQRGPCNCPLCVAAKADLNRHVDQRVDWLIAMHERDQQRRDAWKCRARQHHIDQAGVCCAPRKWCDCPNCVEYREFYARRPTEIFTSVANGRKFRWTWVARPGGWQRYNIDAGKFIGPIVRHIEHNIRTRKIGDLSVTDETIIYENNPGDDSWIKRRFNSLDLDTPWSDPPPKMQTPEVHMMHTRATPATNDSIQDWAKYICATQKDIDAAKRKEQPVLTPLQFAILAHRLAHPNTPYPHEGRLVSDALNGLIEHKMLEHDPCCPSILRLTERAKVLMEAVLTLPLPVRQPAPWTMPS